MHLQHFPFSFRRILSFGFVPLISSHRISIHEFLTLFISRFSYFLDKGWAFVNPNRCLPRLVSFHREFDWNSLFTLIGGTHVQLIIIVLTNLLTVVNRPRNVIKNCATKGKWWVGSRRKRPTFLTYWPTWSSIPTRIHQLRRQPWINEINFFF